MAVDFVRISSAAPFRNLILSRGARWAHEATLQLPVIDVLIGFSIAYEETPRRFSQSWGVYKSNVPIGCQQIFLSFKRRPKRKGLKCDETPASSPWSVYPLFQEKKSTPRRNETSSRSVTCFWPLKSASQRFMCVKLQIKNVISILRCMRFSDKKSRSCSDRFSLNQII